MRALWQIITCINNIKLIKPCSDGDCLNHKWLSSVFIPYWTPLNLIGKKLKDIKLFWKNMQESIFNI